MLKATRVVDLVTNDYYLVVIGGHMTSSTTNISRHLGATISLKEDGKRLFLNMEHDFLGEIMTMTTTSEDDLGLTNFNAQYPL